jgi:ABC-type branched-subunit amino acid transport system ATPase component
VLALQRLTRRYGDLVALDDPCFTVREGQLLSFVGPNGAGKTTAMSRSQRTTGSRRDTWGRR